jgi:outer membrane lipoprotein SlyB
MAHHPMGAVLGGIVSAVLCEFLGSIDGSAVAVVMAALGAVVGAPPDAMLAASSQRAP